MKLKNISVVMFFKHIGEVRYTINKEKYSIAMSYVVQCYFANKNIDSSKMQKKIHGVDIKEGEEIIDVILENFKDLLMGVNIFLNYEKTITYEIVCEQISRTYEIDVDDFLKSHKNYGINNMLITYCGRKTIST